MVLLLDLTSLRFCDVATAVSVVHAAEELPSSHRLVLTGIRRRLTRVLERCGATAATQLEVRPRRRWRCQRVSRTRNPSASLPDSNPAALACAPPQRPIISSRSVMWVVWLSCARSAAILRSNVSVTST